MQVKDIKLGQKVEDKVTRLKGIVTSHTKFLNGCHQLGVSAEKLDKDGDVKKVEYFDIEQLDVISDGIAKKMKKEDTSLSGGPKRQTPGKRI